jgi:hypothetical protein
MNNFWKTITALTLLAAFYAVQNPQAIENIKREKAIYDSLGYAYEATPEEINDMIKLKQEERKGGKKNDR